MRLVTSRSRGTATTSVPSTVHARVAGAPPLSSDGLLVDEEVAHPRGGEMVGPGPGR